MTKMEIDDVEVILEKEIKDGRIIGLTHWNGRKAKVIIVKEETAQ